MPDWNTQKGISITDATPIGDAGVILNDNFERLRDETPFNATSNPSASDDSTDGYFAGSQWFNTSTQVMWICTDATATAAVWKTLYKREAGQIILSPGGDGFVQLGDDLDVNGQAIVSQSSGDIQITPDGGGKIVLAGLNWPASDGSSGQVLKTNGAAGLYFGASGAFRADGNWAAYQGTNVNAGGGSNVGSLAQGSYATANGDKGSFAQGQLATASGLAGSFAQGSYAIASGYFGSFAQGWYATASGSSSFAQGAHATASGSGGSFAQGGALAAGSSGSFAQGITAIAYGGYGCFAQGHQATSLGNSGCFSQGTYVIASGTGGCCAQGVSTTASGRYGSFAQGRFVEASGTRGSLAQGEFATASTSYGSFAQGWFVSAGGIAGSFAQGSSASANGAKGSFAQGVSVAATGSFGSFAQGWLATASGTSGCFAQGGDGMSSAVASGSNGCLAQGRNVSASGNYGSFAQGSSAWATGSRGSLAQGVSTLASGVAGSFAQGSGATASGSGGSFAQGYVVTASGLAGSLAQGVNATASADSSWAQGSACVADKRGQFARATGKFMSDGDAQHSWLIVRNITTNATPTELFLDGSSDRIAVASGKTYGFSILVSARQTTGSAGTSGDSWTYKLEGCIKNVGGTTSIQGSVLQTVIAEADANFDCTASADDMNDALKITATGAADKTVHWVASVCLAEVA